MFIDIILYQINIWRLLKQDFLRIHVTEGNTHFVRLYLIAKCMDAIGPNRVTWRTLNPVIQWQSNIFTALNNIALWNGPDNIFPALSNIAPCDLRHNGIAMPTNGSLIFLNNRCNHSVNKSKSQFHASYIYRSSKYAIILMKRINFYF